jgi:hypothetical protein
LFKLYALLYIKNTQMLLVRREYEAHEVHQARVIGLSHQTRQLIGLVYIYILLPINQPIRPSPHSKNAVVPLQRPNTFACPIFCPFEFIDINKLNWYRIETPCLIERYVGRSSRAIVFPPLRLRRRWTRLCATATHRLDRYQAVLHFIYISSI